MLRVSNHRVTRLGVLWAVAAVACALPLRGQEVELEVKQEITGVGITEQLGDALPLDATFTDQDGKTVRLADYFSQGKPVVVNLVYYGCPGLCTAVLSGLSVTLKEMDWAPGENYHVLTVSFNPADTPALAASKRANYLQHMDRPGAEKGWTFLTGDAANIKRLSEAVGFAYKWNPETEQFMHDAAAIVCTPDGRISRYLRGAYYDPQTFRMSLVEAGGGKIGSLSEQVWLRMCGYDAAQGRYVVIARNVLAAGGAATAVALALVVGFFFLKENKIKRVSV